MRASSTGSDGLRGFIAARFARGYLGRHLTFGFLIAALGLTIFFRLASEIASPSALVDFDNRVHDWIRSHATIEGYGWFGAITELGSPPALLLLGCTGGVVFATQRRWATLLAWGSAFLGGSLLDLTLKMLVGRPRPPFASDYLVRESQSFPSGHSMMSLIGYGMMVYLFIIVRPRHPLVRAVAVAFMIPIIVLVGTSRLYLGVHYPSDVAAGWIAGAAWLSVCITGLEAVRRRAPSPGTSPAPSA